MSPMFSVNCLRKLTRKKEPEPKPRPEKLSPLPEMFARNRRARCLNPLELPCVIEGVAQHLENQDLAQSRLLNRSWNSMATRELRSRKLFERLDTLMFDNAGGGHHNVNHAYDIDDMVRLVEILRSNPNTPYRHVHLNTNILIHAESDLTLKCFMEEISWRLRSLTFLHNLKDGSQLLFENVSRPKNLSFPNLSKFQLILEGKRKPDSRALRSNFRFYADVMKHAPQLTNLTFKSNVESEESFLHFLKAMEGLGDRKIRNMVIQADITDVHVDQLRKMEIRFKTLSLEFGALSNSTGVRNFLKEQAYNIKHLTLGACKLLSSIYVEFPSLIQLQSLVILGSRPRPCERVKFTNVSFEDQFPNIRRVEFHPRAEDNFGEFFNWGEDTKLESMQRLTLPESAVTADWVIHAAKSFPWLKVLELPSNYAMGMAALRNFPGLKELIVNNEPVVWPGPEGSVLHRLPSVVRGNLGEDFANQRLEVFKVRTAPDQIEEWLDVSYEFILMQLRHAEHVYLESLKRCLQDRYYLKRQCAKYLCIFFE